MIPTIGKLYLYLVPSDTVQFVPGPFYLGKIGYAINVYAIIWTLFETGILIMPQLYPVDANTMNYAGPIMGGVVLVSGIWYMAYGVSFAFWTSKGALGFIPDTIRISVADVQACVSHCWWCRARARRGNPRWPYWLRARLVRGSSE